MLAVDRLLLGAAESFILPGMLILLTKWFTRPEHSRANTLLILGNPVTELWMSAVAGVIIKIFGWQMEFIIEGPSPSRDFFARPLAVQRSSLSGHRTEPSGLRRDIPFMRRFVQGHESLKR
jgi:MFS family permease